MTTEKGIYYPTDYSDIADIPADMKEMAESIDDALTSSDGEIEGIKEEQLTQNTQINNNKTDIEAIKVEQTEQNTDIQANTDNITALLEKIDYIEGLIPTDTATGESLTLSNTARYPFKEFNVGGNTEQQSYTGKNLLNITGDTYTDHGITTSVLNGILTSSGTTSAAYYNIWRTTSIDLPAGIYTISITKALTHGLKIRLKNSDNQNETFTIVAGDTSKTFTISEAKVSFLLYAENGISSGQSINETFGVQLEAGSATDYEPYVGGQASPNPSYPQSVENVSGEVEVKVENKNLFNKDIDIISGYVNSYNRYLINSSTNCFLVPCKINTTYTISKISSTRFRIGYITEEPATNIIVQGVLTDHTGTILTITTGENALYLIGYIYDSSADTLTLQQIIDSLQIEEGSTATSYEPHEEQTATLHLPEGMEMCEGDGFVWKNEKWYKNKVFQKVIFDGTENWKTASADWHRYYIEISDVLEKGQILSNYFIRDIELQDHNKELYGKIDTGYWHDGLIFIQDYKAFTTLAEFKTWLSSHNTTVYYQLKEPTLEEITDPTLISDLNNLKNLYSYKGTTYISSSNEPSPVFEVVYRKSLG